MAVENNDMNSSLPEQKTLTHVRHETFLVQPETPTTLDSQETFELVDGNNLIMQFAISSLYVVDGTVNPARFCTALSRTLQRFPTAAGRLRRKGDDWHIDLCNAPVPVHVASSLSCHVLPHPHSDDLLARYEDTPAAAHVVQPTPHVELYVDKVDVAAAMTGASDAYLCSFVLTHMGDGRTVVGLSWNHVLGDQSTTGRFMHTLSASYIAAAQDITHGAPPQPTFGTTNPDLWVLPPPPVFHSRAFPPLPADPLGPMHDSLVRGTSPHVLRSHTFDVVVKLYGEEFAKTEVVALRFDKWEIDALWERAREDERKGAVGAEDLVAERVTRQDALIAYLVTLQNRCSGEAPIHTIQHLMSVRLRQPPAASAQHLFHRHPHVASNCTQIPNIPLHDKRRNDLLAGAERGAWFSESLYEIAEGAPAWPAGADEPQPAGPSSPPAEVEERPSESSLAEGASPLAPYTSLGLIARAFRRGTRLSRPDNWTERYLRLNSARYKEGTRRGRFYMYPASGAVLVNSLMGVDTKDGAHFGFGPVQYYTDVSWERMFRVHDANPTRRAIIASPTGPCAGWTWRDPASSAVVCFRVQNGVRDRMEEAKARDMEVLKAGDALTL